MIKSFKQFINEAAIDNVADYERDPEYGISDWIKDNVGKGDGGKKYMLVTDYDEIEKVSKIKPDGRSETYWKRKKSITHDHYGIHRHLWMDEVLPDHIRRDRGITRYIDASTLDSDEIEYMYDHVNVMNIYCIYNIGSLDKYLLRELIDRMYDDELNVSVLLVTDTEFHDLVNKAPHIPHEMDGVWKF